MDGILPACPHMRVSRVPKSNSNGLKIFQYLTQPSLENGSDGCANQPTDLTWSAPANPGVGVTLGHFRIEPVGPQEARGTRPPDSQAAGELASAPS